MRQFKRLSFSEQFTHRTRKRPPRPSINAAAAVWTERNVPARTANATADARMEENATVKKMQNQIAAAKKIKRPVQMPKMPKMPSQIADVKMQKLANADAKTARSAPAKITKKR